MPNILGLHYDPVLNGVRQSARYNWVEPRMGLVRALEQLNGAMAGSGIQYTMTLLEIGGPAHTKRTYQSQHVDHVDSTPPVYMSAAEWVTNWDKLHFNPAAWPGGGEIHVKEFFAVNDIIGKVNRGEVDEVWTAGGPIPACFEGAMVCPDGDQGAYPTHDTVIKVPGLTRRFVWHMFSTENWNPLHNYFHRIENIMSRIWAGTNGDPGYGVGYAEQWSPPRSMDTIKTYWHLWTMTDNERPGEAQNGAGHNPPNAKLGYVSDMEDVVPSGHKEWLKYPQGFPLNLSRQDRYDLVSVEDWRGRPDYIWQFEHIPRGPGTFDGRWVNWWKYITNVNESLGRNTPTTKPWTGTPPPLPGNVTEYPLLGRALIRWSPHATDPYNAEYEVRVDGLLSGKLKRRVEVHTKLSLDVPIATTTYSVGLLGGWSDNYPRPTPTPPDGGTVLLTKDEIAAIIHEMHVNMAIFAGFPEPSGYEEDAATVKPYWLTAAFGKLTRVIQRQWLPAQIRQFYQLMYQFGELRGGVIPPTPPPPPPPPVNPQLTVAQVQVIVDALHATLPQLANCPKPWAYRMDNATGDILIHWSGQTPVVIDKDWAVATVQSVYTAMYPKAICSGPPPPVVPPPPTPTPGVAFDVKPLVDTIILAQEAALGVWRAFRARLP